ncbi:feruloyl esterase [Paenibacillus sp. CF095]|uniref:tannase/feruloyl esterase family alpha/beta hydrolase n=1 Tax=Paenibacillus sp. CF095 TaxID=1881033 RepID=UPI0008808791|nr:tannase/feruloyl esterase family alpha/beta hydrolase [Paenibacillus sp. CF095]SDD54109.1 feruloyl esterase [Paenibacillus sp. CF095]
MVDTNIDKIKKFPLEDGEITNVEWKERIKTPEPNPLGFKMVDGSSFYRVVMKLHPTAQSNITVMMYLPEPEAWNGKFLGTGNGGYAGSIAEGALMNGIGRGYATANTDLGTTPDPNDCIGLPEVLIDYGHRATHLMTVVGKQLTTYFYGEAPKYSYFAGGSTGGQQGFSEAQRYPEDYDGIISLSPAFDRVRLHSFFVWNWQQLHGRKEATFTPDQAQKWKDSIVKVYGKECGSNDLDPFLAYPGGIKGNPMDHPTLQEAIEEQLTDGQKEALRIIYDGPKDPVTGDRFIAPFLPGSEAEFLSLVDMSNKDQFAHGLLFPFRWIWGKDFNFEKFDFHKDLQEAIAQLSPILDATNPDLSAFKARGGKLLVVGGSVDAIIPYTGFLNYYHKVIAEQGGLEETKRFFRFLLMPGFSHTAGGTGVQEVGIIGLTEVPRDPDHDVICALEQWVEQGVAPERLLGTHFKKWGSGIEFDHARPSYAYPYVAKYTGGDPKNPENYIPVEDAEAYE